MSFPGGSEGKESPAMRETWVRSLGWEDTLEKGIATHSSIPAWRIPWTGILHAVPKRDDWTNAFHSLTQSILNNIISGTQSHSDPITYHLLGLFPLIYFCNTIYFALPSLPLIHFLLPVISPWLILTGWKTSQIWSQIPSNYTLHLCSWKGWRKTKYPNTSPHFRTLAGNMQCTYNAI